MCTPAVRTPPPPPPCTVAAAPAAWTATGSLPGLGETLTPGLFSFPPLLVAAVVRGLPWWAMLGGSLGSVRVGCISTVASRALGSTGHSGLGQAYLTYIF